MKRRGVTAKVHLKVLTEHLPTILEYDSIFMQDNTLIHKAHKLKAFFEELGIEVIPWPLYSPNLNPIENIAINGTGNGFMEARNYHSFTVQNRWEDYAYILLLSGPLPLSSRRLPDLGSPDRNRKPLENI